jgi:hypothetical protein
VRTSADQILPPLRGNRTKLVILSPPDICKNCLKENPENPQYRLPQRQSGVLYDCDFRGLWPKTEQILGGAAIYRRLRRQMALLAKKLVMRSKAEVGSGLERGPPSGQ